LPIKPSIFYLNIPNIRAKNSAFTQQDNSPKNINLLLTRSLVIQFNPFPILETERLLLRQLTEGDLDAILAIRSDPEVMRYVCRPLMQSREEAAAWYKNVEEILHKNTGINWAICLKPDTRMIGSMALWRIDKDNHRGEVGYMLPPQYWGKGITTEALTIAIDYAFETLHLHSLEGQIDPANIASRRVLEKHGFVQEAYFKENFYFNGQFLDTVVLSLLNGITEGV
jgi:[ribosomal protein S5]-alanine N-acetyltransferase